MPSTANNQDSAGPTPLQNSVSYPHVGILALVPDQWDGPYQSRHQILTRLSHYFTVVWVNPAEGWHAARITETRGATASVPSSFTVYRPPRWLPKFERPAVVSALTDRIRLKQAAHMLASLGCTTTVLSVWRPEFEPAMDIVRHDLSCYHIDDEYSFSPIEQPITGNERRLIERVDQVFISSRMLLEKKGHLNPCTMLVPNGANYPAYVAEENEPEDLRGIPHPRIGYVGNIKTHLDFTLLIALAQRHPEWSLVFVGGNTYLGSSVDQLDRLKLLPNVYFTGLKPVFELPAYTQHLDVCILPYLLNAYTKYIYPLKLHEYLASGRPVVGSPIPAIQEFDNVIEIATDLQGWSNAIAHALSPSMSSPAMIQARRRIALAHDWDTIVRRMAEAICARLGLQ